MSGRVPLAGVIGHPVAHSRSPALHGHWLSRYGLRGHYVPLDVSAEDLAEVLATLPRMGFVGVNVTVPHKEAALRLAAEATPRARAIGSANTLTFLENGGFHADNTDAEGFIANLRQGAPDWRPESGAAVVIGAGGAARGVVHALVEAGVPHICVVNRTAARAKALADDFGEAVRAEPWHRAAAALGRARLLVNASSLGMAGGAELDLPLDGLDPGAVVTDIVYTPLETRLLREARARGCTTVDGLGMLLWQAAPGFEGWFGRAPAVDEDLRRAVLG